MKTDLYTKAVLTVIAVSLTGIAIQLTIKESHAQHQPTGRYVFSPSGALVVSICDANFKNNLFSCAEVDKLERN